MSVWMLNLINTFGYLGIFLLIFIENVFPPIPSEAVLLFAGALCGTSTMSVPGAILAATAGSVAGAWVLYALGYFLQADRLAKILEGKTGRILHLRPDHVHKAESWFAKYDAKAVFICRCIPIVRSLISIPAGFARMPFMKFTILTLLGSAIWNSILVICGSVLKDAWASVLPFFEQYTLIAAAVIIILVIGAAVCLFRKKHSRSKLSQDRSLNNPAH